MIKLLIEALPTVLLLAGFHLIDWIAHRKEQRYHKERDEQHLAARPYHKRLR